MCQRGPPPVLSSGLGALSPPALGREAVVGSAGPRGGGPLTAGAPCKQGRQPLWPLPRVPSCLCPEGPAPRSGWDCAVRRREAVGEENGRGVARDGSADAVRRRGALREESGAVERDGEARARKKSVGFVLKTGREKGPLGKGPSLASRGRDPQEPGGQLPAAPAGLALGGPPCKQGWVLWFAWRWPFAIALLWLPGARGNRPVRRARVPASAPEGGNGALPTPQPARPVSRAGLFPLAPLVPAGGPWPE
ncbi:uncharacterized protein LOC116791069 [Chiroxiphia lanceolata]|uniref:uncharacterized protein LOC116791069 n=1 Tax=Chiroxiphia lanceolata TaxID=296741 RepID=UPI0013CEBF4A|nr:uncharacterized protein LOC116791069 [Chiroxiphia lanceolata]